MAADEALLRCAEANRPTLRLYEWRRPALTCGYFQEFASQVDLESCRKADIELARRPTGGGVVVHDGAYTFSVVAPMGTPGIPAETQASYRRFAEAASAAFAELGAATAPAESCVRAEPGLPEWCLFRPVEHDIVGMDGRKVAGAAQRRIRGAFLHQAYVVMESPSEGTLRAGGGETVLAAARRRSVALTELVGRPVSAEEFSTALIVAFARVFDAAFCDVSLSDEEAEAVDVVLETHRSDEWRFGGASDRRRLRREGGVNR